MKLFNQIKLSKDTSMTQFLDFAINVLSLTDKRTDVCSRNFLLWEINFGLWAVAWAGPWEKDLYVKKTW